MKLGVAKRQHVETCNGEVGTWFTPPWCARDFITWVGVEGQRVIDAGAGEGALTLAVVSQRARSVLAIEHNARLVETLEDVLGPFAPCVRIAHADLLAAHDDRRQSAFAFDGHAADVALTNCPWEEDLPERFLRQMIQLAPRACAILPLNVLCGVNRARVWREELEPVRARALARRPVFKGLTGGMRDVCFLEVRRRRAPVPDSRDVIVPLEVAR